MKTAEIPEVIDTHTVEQKTYKIVGYKCYPSPPNRQIYQEEKQLIIKIKEDENHSRP